MRTLIPSISSAGHGAQLVLAPSDQLNGNSFVNDGNTTLGIYNPDQVNAISVTIRPAIKIDSDLTVSNRMFDIPANSTWVIGRLPTSVYNQPDGTIWIDFSATALIAVVSFA